MIWIVWGMITICLLAACITDLRSFQVYNLTWWISGGAALILYPLGGYWPGKEQMCELLLFLLLQNFLFSRWYGRADCYAFSVCALAGGSRGFGLLECLIHMLIAFSLLAVVQLLKRNINSRGNLKTPVAFLPYITLAFWGMLWYHISC